MPLFIIAAIVVAAVIAFAVILYREQRDKEIRKATGQPARKYHDITDYDVTVIETIVRK